ncbi:MAG: hypothetical protein ACR2KJ_02995 [Jatrophihabitans sp.]
MAEDAARVRRRIGIYQAVESDSVMLFAVSVLVLVLGGLSGVLLLMHKRTVLDGSHLAMRHPFVLAGIAVCIGTLLVTLAITLTGLALRALVKIELAGLHATQAALPKSYLDEDGL